MRRRRSGQSLLEYVLLLGFVIGIAMGSATMARRGVQASVVGAANDMRGPYDHVNPKTGERLPGGYLARDLQLDGIRFESGDRDGRERLAPGTIVARVSQTRTSSARVVHQSQAKGGSTTRTLPKTVPAGAAITPKRPNVSETEGTLDLAPFTSDRRLQPGAASFSEVVVEVK